jgi:hypothetical protein
VAVVSDHVFNLACKDRLAALLHARDLERDNQWLRF